MILKEKISFDKYDRIVYKLSMKIYIATEIAKQITREPVPGQLVSYADYLELEQKLTKTITRELNMAVTHKFVKCKGCRYEHYCLIHKICFFCGYEESGKK